jgi:hypothetical protein
MVVSYIPPTPGYNKNGSYTKTKSNLAYICEVNGRCGVFRWNTEYN